MMRIIDCIQIQKYPPRARRRVPRLLHLKIGGAVITVRGGGGGTERSPWFSTRTSHASPDDGDGTFKPYYTVDDGAWDRHAATFSNSIRDPHEGYRNMLGHAVVSCVYQTTGK